MITIADLLKTKREKTRKTVIMEVKEYNGQIKMEIPTNIEMEALVKLEDEQMKIESIYKYCLEPNLKNEELLKAFDCSHEPYQIVNKIFDVKTSLSISVQLIKAWEKSLVNYEVKLVEEIKNS